MKMLDDYGRARRSDQWVDWLILWPLGGAFFLVIRAWGGAAICFGGFLAMLVCIAEPAIGRLETFVRMPVARADGGVTHLQGSDGDSLS